MNEPLIFDLSRSGRRGYTYPQSDVPTSAGLNDTLLRKSPAQLPQFSELDVVRHFSRFPA
jgi:glycine dehydrogenase subunit 2